MVFAVVWLYVVGRLLLPRKWIYRKSKAKRRSWDHPWSTKVLTLKKILLITIFTTIKRTRADMVWKIPCTQDVETTNVQIKKNNFSFESVQQYMNNVELDSLTHIHLYLVFTCISFVFLVYLNTTACSQTISVLSLFLCDILCTVHNHCVISWLNF